MDKERVFVVVLGGDQRGIVARVSGLLFEQDCNIEDIQQKVMDGTFVMTLLADVSSCPVGVAGLREALAALAGRMGLTVMVQNESVIKAMQRV